MQYTIFNEKYLKPFFKAIFNISPYIDKKGEIAANFPADVDIKSKRMLAVCNWALNQISLRYNAIMLAPNAWKIIKEIPSSTQDEIYGTNSIQAIQIEGNLFLKKTLDDVWEDYERRCEL